MLTVGLVIAQAIDYFDGNPSPHVETGGSVGSAGDVGYCFLIMRSTAAVIIIGYRNGKLHVCAV